MDLARSPEEARASADDMLANGFTIVRNVFSPAYIRQLHDFFIAGYQHYFQNKAFDDALKVGDQRTMVTVKMEGPFNTPQLYANEHILDILKHLLGNRMILGGLGAVTSLPGAPEQHLHRDFPGLFEPLDASFPDVPPYAITVIVPLVPLTEQNGTTRMGVGSHRLDPSTAGPVPVEDPLTDAGDCIFMDYRTAHFGLANRSDAPRPILYVTYFRVWFRDYLNYHKQSPLIIPDDEYAKTPEQYRYLLEWSRRGQW